MPDDGDSVPTVSNVTKGTGESEFSIVPAPVDTAGSGQAEVIGETGSISGTGFLYVGKERETGAGNCKFLWNRGALM